jgi:hypothetical protein
MKRQERAAAGLLDGEQGDDEHGTGWVTAETVMATTSGIPRRCLSALAGTSLELMAFSSDCYWL